MLALTKVNHISFNHHRHSIPLNKIPNHYLNADDQFTAIEQFSSDFENNNDTVTDTDTDTDTEIKTKAKTVVLRQQFMENTTKEYFNDAIKILFVVIYCVHKKAQYLRSYINEYSPLVLFSWWRNKIS